MIVKDLRNSFNPCPKGDNKINAKTNRSTQKKEKKNKEEIKAKEIILVDFCIMPQSTKYSTKRTKKYCERHEVYFSRAYRNKSIKDGLIVFLTEEDHRGTNGVHGKNGNKLNRHLKKIGKKAWIDFYKKTEEEFIERYGKINI